MMKLHAHKIGAVFYGLWGLLHIIGGLALWQQLAAGGSKAVLASLGSALPPAEIPAISGNLSEAVLAFFAWNWVGLAWWS